MNTIFFGSTDDSVIVVGKLVDKLKITAVITQPPKPVGRHQTITPTPVEVWANNYKIPVYSFQNNKEKPWIFENENEVNDTLCRLQPDLLISASFGQKIPTTLINSAKFGGLNIHPSLLPRWRGADPVPWAILKGDNETGVSLVTIAEKFDQGRIIAQEKIPITDTDLSDPLRTKLFEIGAELLLNNLDGYLSGKNTGIIQNIQNEPYAKRFKREDGFEPWENIEKAMTDSPSEAERIDRKYRALNPWPGLFTIIRNSFIVNRKTTNKTDNIRLIIRKCHLENNRLILDTVQMEGKKPVNFKQFKLINAILT